MKWKYNTSKVLKVMSAIRNIARNINAVFPPTTIDDIVRKFVALSPVKERLRSKDATALYPIEVIRGYSIYNRLPNRQQAFKELSDSKYAIASIDSSYHSPGAHGYIPFIVHNVGIWYVDYNNEVGGEDSEVFADIKVSYGDMRERIWMKQNEAKILRNLVKLLNGELNFVMLDESLSIGYTISWSNTDREEYAHVIADYVNFLIDNNIIPLGIYYTRSIDIVRGMRDMGVVSDDEFKNSQIPDKMILNKILGCGDRSPIFNVYSYAHMKTGLELNAIYVKVGDYNTLRVEFPAKTLKLGKDVIEDIHRVVLLESIIGDGYPYPLQASHENAVLTSEVRDAIVEVFSEVLGIRNELYVSSKEMSKRWPLA